MTKSNFFKRLFGKSDNKSEQKHETVRGSSKSNYYNGNVTDKGLSRQKIINIPKLGQPENSNYYKPQEYWDVYNKGISQYKKGKYLDAKGEFLKLFEYENPHNTFYGDVLRTYRKIVNELVAKHELQNAYEVYTEFFKYCNDHITDTDKKKFNKLIDMLSAHQQNINYKKIELVKEEGIPPFQLSQSNSCSIKLINEEKIKLKDYSKKQRIWNIEGRSKTNIFYINRYEGDKCDKSSILTRNDKGEIENEIHVDGRVYRISAADDTDKFIALSEDVISGDFKLSFLTKEDGLTSVMRFKKDDDIRSVDISPDGRFVVFTYADKAFIVVFGSKEAILKWKAPIKEGWEARNAGEEIPKDYQVHLSSLNLTGHPSEDEIKKAFRILILQYHPDRNPNDKYAEEKTKEIIKAYKALTHEDIRKVLQGIDKAEYFYKISQEEIKIPGTDESITITLGYSFAGGGEDWICKSHLTSNAERLYLGCYSGRIYCVSKDGTIIKQYNYCETIDSIHEKGNYLFFETLDFLLIVKNDEYMTHVKKDRNDKLLWTDKGFILIKKDAVSFFSDEGIEIGKILFQKNIYDLYWVDGCLKVITTNKAYQFSIL